MTQTESGVNVHVVSKLYDIDSVVTISQYGRHNVLNALACICVGLELNIDFKLIASSLASFAGISRRFNTTGMEMTGGRHITVIDDYGHHPTEMANVIETTRNVFPGRRLVFVFEPHRYSRVRDLFDAFVETLFKADYQLVLPVYAASETETHGMSSSVICDSLRSLGAKDAHTVSDSEALFSVLEHVLEDGDVVLFMGAGNVGRIVKQFIEGATI
jgi:UDP-N-acetylmuramate--alanine ligase